MVRTMHARIVLVASFLWCACGGLTDSEPLVSLSTNDVQYAIGDTATLTVVNHGPERIYPRDLLGCTLEAQRLVDGVWETHSHPGTSGCRGVNPFEPGQEIQRRLPINAHDFEAGVEYRLMTRYLNARRDVAHDLFSNAFLVTADLAADSGLR